MPWPERSEIMGPVDYLVLAAVAAILLLAARYIYRAKKSGKGCIGCPDSGSCSGHCGSCGCQCPSKREK